MMNIAHIKKHGFSMPFSSPTYPKGPYVFKNREFFIIAYETDIELLREIVPEPLEVVSPIVKFEFIRMPDSTGFGDYTESGQVIPVMYQGKHGNYVHSMYLDDEAPIAAGREIWGFPKELASPKLQVKKETLIGQLEYEGSLIAEATMGFKYQSLDLKAVHEALMLPNYLLKIIPHVDGSMRVCELVEYYLQDVQVKGAWTGPAALHLKPHAMAPLADLPVRKIISASHIMTDLVLPYGKVVFDYLA